MVLDLGQVRDFLRSPSESSAVESEWEEVNQDEVEQGFAVPGADAEQVAGDMWLVSIAGICIVSSADIGLSILSCIHHIGPCMANNRLGMGPPIEAPQSSSAAGYFWGGFNESIVGIVLVIQPLLGGP